MKSAKGILKHKYNKYLVDLVFFTYQCCHVLVSIFDSTVRILCYGTRKKGHRKNVLKKLFSVERELRNLNDFFIFIN